MNIPKIKKGWAITFIVIIILAILNPSIKDFKEFTGYAYATRKANFLIFSIYENHFEGTTTDYAGVLLNFIELKPTPPSPPISVSTINNERVDSTKMTLDEAVDQLLKKDSTKMKNN